MLSIFQIFDSVSHHFVIFSNDNYEQNVRCDYSFDKYCCLFVPVLKWRGRIYSIKLIKNDIEKKEINILFIVINVYNANLNITVFENNSPRLEKSS